MALVSRLLQQRHRYYRALLGVEVIALLALSSLQAAPRLMSVVYLVVSGIGVLFDSPLLPRHRLDLEGQMDRLSVPNGVLAKALVRRSRIASAWLICLTVELLWQASLAFKPALTVHLSALHLVVWLTLILFQLWGLVNALVEEPVFNGALVMGAAGGYLMVGFAGGITLNSLLVLVPDAFNLPASTSGGALPAGIAHAPAMLGAAFACLTTLGSPLLREDHLTALTASVAITVIGQLYLAILIAGVLGKPRQLAAIRKAAQRRKPGSTAPGRLRRTRG